MRRPSRRTLCMLLALALVGAVVFLGADALAYSCMSDEPGVCERGHAAWIRANQGRVTLAPLPPKGPNPLGVLLNALGHLPLLLASAIPALMTGLTMAAPAVRERLGASTIARAVAVATLWCSWLALLVVVCVSVHVSAVALVLHAATSLPMLALWIGVWRADARACALPSRAELRACALALLLLHAASAIAWMEPLYQGLVGVLWLGTLITAFVLTSANFAVHVASVHVVHHRINALAGAHERQHALRRARRLRL